MPWKTAGCSPFSLRTKVKAPLGADDIFHAVVDDALEALVGDGAGLPNQLVHARQRGYALALFIDVARDNPAVAERQAWIEQLALTGGAS